MEVERLDQLKASRMKESAFKKQAVLEEISACALIEIDSEAAQHKILALIDSGNIEPAELLADMGNQIVKAKEEAHSRKEILDKVEKWMAACEEESWLEDYNRVYSLLFSMLSFLFSFFTPFFFLNVWIYSSCCLDIFGRDRILFHPFTFFEKNTRF